MIQDAVRLERRGIPTVAVCTHDFEVASRYQAQVQGLPSLKLAVVPKPAPGQGREFMRETAERAFAAVLDGLLVPRQRPRPG